MSEPIFPIIETDPSELYRIGMDRIVELAPDFDADVTAAPEAWLMEAVAEVAADINDTASVMPENLFVYYGQEMLGIQLTEGSSSIAEITVTCGDTLGHTIPEATAFLLYLDGETSFEFICTEDIVIPNGVDTGTFEVVCTSTTDLSNDAGVAGAELVDALSFVSSIAVDVAAAGGAEDETEEEYVERLTDLLQLLSTRPITAHDFEISARANFGGRWSCLDTYDAVLDAWDNPLTVTMVGVKDDGTLFSAPEKAAVLAFFELNRLTNFVIHVIDPDLEPIDVSFSITVSEGFDPADTLALAEANVAEFISPAYWGQPPTGDEIRWDTNTVVRYFAMVNVVLNTIGVESLDTLLLDGLTVDYNLANEWTLADNGTITGAIT